MPSIANFSRWIGWVDLTYEPKLRLLTYVIAALLMGIALGIRMLIAPIDAGLQYITFFPAVSLVVLIGGVGPGLLAMLLGVLFGTYFFTYPYYSFDFESIRRSLLPNIAFVLDGTIVLTVVENMRNYQNAVMGKKLQNVNRSLQLLSACNETVIRSKDEKSLLDDICRLIVESGGFQATWVGYPEHDENKSILPIARAGHDDGYVDSVQASWDDNERGNGPAGTAIRMRKTQVSQRIFEDSRMKPWASAASSRGFRSNIAIPLVSNETMFGVLSIYSSNTDSFLAEEVALLEKLAGNLAFGISNLQLAEAQMKSRLELRIAASAFDAQDSIMITDPDLKIVRVNSSFCELTGYAEKDIIGCKPSILSSGAQDAQFYKEMWGRIVKDGKWKGEVEDRRKDGTLFMARLAITAVKDEEGKIVCYVGMLNDITRRKRAEEKVRQLAYYDTLTDLPNRRFFYDRLSQVQARSARSGRHGAILLLDLDNFKIVNDTLGHEIGDELLKQVAQRISLTLREGDMVARLGGDEFVVLLDDLSEDAISAAGQAEAVGWKILAVLSQPYRLEEKIHQNTPSVGVSLFNGRALKPEDVLRQADIAMYDSKRSGRNTLRFFDIEMQKLINIRMALEEDLHEALQNNQFRLFYQAQVDGADCVFGAEGLIRWQHPVRGLVPPNEFIPVMEETRQIESVGRWVLDTACAQIKAWERDESAQHLVLSVNVSSVQFQQTDFVEQVRDAVGCHAIDPGKLKLELTEGMLLKDIDGAIAKMEVLRELGVLLSLDDFGTGYSSLSYLKNLPLNQLKIDKSFVQDIESDESDRAIVKSIIELARNLNLQVIAEGVETDEQRKFLNAKGCFQYQGYLFGKPVPIDQFEAQLLGSAGFERGGNESL